MLAIAVASQALLDWLGTDPSAPIGIMALRPFSRGYSESDAHVFMAVSRRYGLEASTRMTSARWRARL